MWKLSILPIIDIWNPQEYKLTMPNFIKFKISRPFYKLTFMKYLTLKKEIKMYRNNNTKINLAIFYLIAIWAEHLNSKHV